ncbi:MAG: EAL domain-containing protein (putative c-di-GMP-specific phosphodiesterase class I), partial [Glaciecola sp.]
GLEVIAEGVEELHQLTYLKNLGCQYIQGYYFSKPLLEKDAIEYAKKHSNQVSSSNKDPYHVLKFHTE